MPTALGTEEWTLINQIRSKKLAYSCDLLFNLVLTQGLQYGSI